MLGGTKRSLFLLLMSESRKSANTICIESMKRSTTRSRLHWTLLSFLLCVSSVVADYGVSVGNASTLNLTLGLHITVLDIALSVLATAAYEEAYFLPILSSPSFYSSNSSAPAAGFSLGFFYNGSYPGRDIYLALCGGLSGSIHNVSNSSNAGSLSGLFDNYTLQIQPHVARNGYAVPTWFANQTPLLSYEASLMVVEETQSTSGGAASKRRLQLVDSDATVFWSVLSIYNTTAKTHVVWQIPRNTLFLGQKLMAGSQLRSQDSMYVARMEQGGLALYSYAIHFMNNSPTPYWAIPALFDGGNKLNMSNLVLSTPCTSNAAHAEVTSACFLSIVPGPCNEGSASMILPDSWESQTCGPMSFVKLENDGRLVIHTATPWMEVPGEDTPSISTQISWLGVVWYPVNSQPEINGPMDGFCGVPNACGPVGICASFTESPCTCPLSLQGQVDGFTAVDSNDPQRGCKRTTKLPACKKDEHVNTTDFLELQHTTSSLLFSGWDFNAFSGLNTDSCKQSCSSSCSCTGFFYVINTSSCFYITDEMSLLNVNSSYYSDINATNYVTYLKKVKTPAPGASGGAAGKIIGAAGKIIVITIISSIVVVGLLVYVLLAWPKARMRRQAKLEAEQEEEALREVLPLLPTRFSFQDLQHATEGFSRLLGAGGFGSVFAGTLPDGREVAVKSLELTLKGHSREFLAEVATIGQTNHQNIVRLVGFCWEVSRRLLVYEFMEGGSLDQWLFRKAGKDGQDGGHGTPVLDWKARYNVVLGVVRGLCYLHEECSQPILHFDIKPQNILLDSAFVAKLADFGMSKLLQRDATQVVTGVRGTPGYIPPEWLSHGAVSKKTDVYSMGMVMLEIVGGRKNVDMELLNSGSNDGCSGSKNDDAWYFPRWAARKCEEGSPGEIVDKRLQGAFDEEEARRLIYTAFWCIQQDPGLRPYAPNMLQWLEGSSPVKKPPYDTAVRSQIRCTPTNLSEDQYINPSSASVLHPR